MKTFPPLFAIAAVSALTSCGTMDSVRTATASTREKAAELSKFSLSGLRPAKIKIAEVREKDLQEMPTGRERALAFEKKRKHNFWFAGGPVEFQEPLLPQPGGEMDGSLLPPLE